MRDCKNNICLTVVLTLAAVVYSIVRAFCPQIILPELDGVNLVGLSLAALVAGSYLPGEQEKFGWYTPVLGAVSFGLMSWACGMASPVEALKIAGLGGVVFAATAWVFGSALDRISTGPVAKAAPVVSAIGIFLAAQCLMGIL